MRRRASIFCGTREAESAARARLESLGVLGPLQEYGEPEPSWRVPAKAARRGSRLPGGGLAHRGRGQDFPAAGSDAGRSLSGVDWFELHGEVEYGDTSCQAAGPAGGAPARRRHGPARRRHLRPAARGLAAEFGHRSSSLGDSEDDHMRFAATRWACSTRSGDPAGDRCDEVFARIARGVAQLRGRRGSRAAGRFRGAAARLSARRARLDGVPARFGFGGCLADDMGVGKTAQVLALLESGGRAAGAGDAGPSLVVVPQVARLQLEAGGGAVHSAA